MFGSHKQLKAAPAACLLASSLVDLDLPPFQDRHAERSTPTVPAHIPKAKAKARARACTSTLAASEKSYRTKISPRDRLRTGIPQVDADVLQGGFRYGPGGVACLSVAPALAASFLDSFIYSTLTTHLLSSTQARAFFVDPLGSFAPLRLLRSLVNAITVRRSGIIDEDENVHRANGSTHAGHSAEKSGRNDGPEQERLVVPSGKQAETAEQEATRAMDRVALMRIFDYAGLIESLAEIKQALSLFNSMSVSREDPGEEPDAPETRSQILLILPGIHTIISPLMRANHVRGHASMVSLANSLQRITRSHHMACLLFSTTTGESFFTAQQQLQSEGRRPLGNKNEDPSPSAFEANGTIRPALGKTWTYCIDLSILVTNPLDNSTHTAAAHARPRAVLEVVADRYGDWHGRSCFV